MTRIEIVIDELVLRGVDAGDRFAVAGAVEDALHAHGAEWAGSGRALGSRSESGRRAPAVTSPIGEPRTLGLRVGTALWDATTGRPA
ncbi:MAG TPA: hypothetical protein VIG64_13480 [Actinomycetota bacterium]